MFGKASQKHLDISERLDSEAERSTKSCKRPFQARFLLEKRRSISSCQLKCNLFAKSTANLALPNEPAISPSVKSRLPAEEGSTSRQPVKILKFKFLQNQQMFSKQTERIVHYEKQHAPTCGNLLHAQFNLATEHKTPALSPETQTSPKKELSILVQNTPNQPTKWEELIEAHENLEFITFRNQPFPAETDDRKPQTPVSTPVSAGLKSLSLSKFLDSSSTRQRGTAIDMQSFHSNFIRKNGLQPLSASLKRNGRYSGLRFIQHDSKSQKLDDASENRSRRVSFAKNILIYRYTTERHIRDASALKRVF